MNWIAFGYALLACAGSGCLYGGVSLAVNGAHRNKPLWFASGLVIAALTVSAAIGLLV
jgi:hypothetical protein